VKITSVDDIGNGNKVFMDLQLYVGAMSNTG
jgi:hypothetical protein